MARRYRYEHWKRKRERERARAERLENQSDAERSLREFLGWVVYILIVVCATYLIVTYVGQRTKVSGDSMLNTLHNEDNLIVDKISYRFRAPKRYEIIVFPYRYAEDTYYIKRIIGLPGETVQIIGGYVYIDGVPLEEDEAYDKMADPGIAETEMMLGSDEYFVLGDNRNNSEDSRSGNIGAISGNAIVGKAWFHLSGGGEDFGFIK